ncbi:MAG: HAD hydrolase family protein [Actinomycetota bacterium]|nr:HAD hydrolase family protein [Actinomycetota bacterium]
MSDGEKEIADREPAQLWRDKGDAYKRRCLRANRRWLSENLGRVRVVYTDVDGTLLGPGGCLFLAANKKYTLKPAKAIIAAQKRGLDIVMISGRSARQLHGDARILGLKNYIAELGCQIVYDLGRKNILNVGDFPCEGKTVLEAINESGAVDLLFQTFPGKLEYHTPWSEGRECTHVFRGYIDVGFANELLRERGHDDLEVVDNGIIHTLGGLKGIPEIHAYHLLPKGGGKPAGLRRDREIRNIPKRETVAIGDAFADLALAPEVGALFLVRNALNGNTGLAEEIVKYKNVFVTEEEMGLGFAEVIDYLVKEKAL